MPKETFFNLKEEKRELIENVALNEFASHGLTGASVNRIIKESGISTGSFYQYFEDIKDLFVYTYSKFGSVKMEYMKEEIANLPDDSFDSVVRAMYRGGLRFAAENVVANKMFNSASTAMDMAALQDVMDIIPQMDITAWFCGIIQKSMDRGEIRNDIPMELFLPLFVNINLAVIDYVLAKSTAKDGVLSSEDLDLFTELALSILLDGLR